MKKYYLLGLFLVLACVLSQNLFAQKKVKRKDVRKSCNAGLYEKGINLGYNFIQQNPSDFETHYLLAQAYSNWSSDFVEQQNKNIQLQKIENWTAKDYENNISLWKKIVSYQDSSIFFYKKSGSFINDVFLTKNSTICGSGFGTCYTEFNDNYTLESVRQYIDNEINTIQNYLTSNKAKFKDEKDKYILWKMENGDFEIPEEYRGSYVEIQGEGGDCSVNYTVSENKILSQVICVLDIDENGKAVTGVDENGNPTYDLPTKTEVVKLHYNSETNELSFTDGNTNYKGKFVKNDTNNSSIQIIITPDYNKDFELIYEKGK